MARKRVLVGYGIDVDAVSGHINTTDGSRPDLAGVSRGVYGATVGVHRLLRLCHEKRIKCSWFIPGHTIESFPKEMALIRDAGHEIGLHGYSHEYSASLTGAQLDEILGRTIALMTNFTGLRPKGFTAPAWKNHPDQVRLLEEHGILYDHSFMHNDFHPYYTPYASETVMTTDYDKEPAEWMIPLDPMRVSRVVEIPASWALDDWPPFNADPSRPGSQGYVDPYNVERQWKDAFTYCYTSYNSFIFPITIHPQVSGRPHILMMHSRLIDWINRHEGVEWCTFAEMAEEFKAGRI